MGPSFPRMNGLTINSPRERGWKRSSTFYEKSLFFNVWNSPLPIGNRQSPIGNALPLFLQRTHPAYGTPPWRGFPTFGAWSSKMLSQSAMPLLSQSEIGNPQSAMPLLSQSAISIQKCSPSSDSGCENLIQLVSNVWGKQKPPCLGRLLFFSLSI